MYNLRIRLDFGVIMDELIKSITEAEEKATAMKNEAVIKAGQIIEAARAEAAKIDEQSAEQCARFINESLNDARVKADKDYAAYIEKSKTDAKIYADSMRNRVNSEAYKIVGRITDGNS